MREWFWAVAAPLPRATVAALAEDDWTLVPGAGHCMIVDRHAVLGPEEALAQQLSRLAGDAPVYLLVYTETVNRAVAYIAGEAAGVVGASPHAVAFAVGCPLEDGQHGDVDLTPRIAPKAAPGERVVYGRTLAQWHHDMTYEDSWEDAAEELDDALPAIELLEDPQPDVRVIGYRLIAALGARQCVPHAARAIAALDAFAKSGPPLLAINAREDADELTVRLDKQLVAAELPWIEQPYAEVATDELLRLLADPRVSIRRAVYAWLAGCARRDDRIPLATFLANVDEPDRIARDYAGYALGNLR